MPHWNRVTAALLIVCALALAAPDSGVADARAFAAATDAALARGDYQAALVQTQKAFELHQRLGADADAAWDLNAAGLANQYLGRYAAALDAYRRALTLDRRAKSRDGEITRLNNIGNVHLLQGRYSDALLMYQDAQRQLAAAPGAATGRLRKMTLSNLAVLNQRIGADERALDYYDEVASSGAMQPAEEAQLLVNRGALARRLGDPVKALDLYRSAQQLFARAAHADGEVSAWRNIGIVYALDLADYDRALDAFNTALRLARGSKNPRGEAQALLYRGEVLRRLGRDQEARQDLEAAFDASRATGLVEDQWKALYGIGLVAAARGDRPAARAAFERAIAAFESVRSDLRTVALRAEFLADKRDVYDALIWLRLGDEPVRGDDVFRLLEQSRARAWRDRVQPAGGAPSLSAVQAVLPADAMLLEYWFGSAGMARLAITRDTITVTRRTGADPARAAQQLADAVGNKESAWRPASAAAGTALLSELPALARVRHLLIAADGPLHAAPFETITLPASGALVVERMDVSYVPSAAFLTLPHRAARRWAWPWQRALAAFGDPAAAGSYPLETRALPRLPYAAVEVQQAARTLPGRAEVHLGADALRQTVLDGRLRSTPVVHFSTHAVADTRDPDRSRILLAPASPGGPADYLFLRDVTDLDLSGVSLVTLSACDTERGKVVRGEGVEGFSRALLAAGAGAAVTTLWEVADRPGAELVTQFLYAAGTGRTLADALREAKLRFLRSGLAWQHPYYWAGYVLTGDGAAALPRVVPWPAIAGAAAVLLVLVSAVIRAAGTAKRSTSLRRTAGQSRQSAPMR
ncbi:MAG: Tetratricopeptide 2 repeat protein [Acidobacteria bacterium]|nr:Tetratricopeptide 2 repeat protein [Acidobacteriota bacterium]